MLHFIAKHGQEQSFLNDNPGKIMNAWNEFV